MKKLLTSLMVLCLMLTMMPIYTGIVYADEETGVYVGNINVAGDGSTTTYWKASTTSTGPIEVSDESDSWTVKYEPGAEGSASTLTLSGAAITVSHGVDIEQTGVTTSYDRISAAIYSYGDLNIVAEGANTVTGGISVGEQNYTNYYTCGIYVDGNLTFFGEDVASLTTTGGARGDSVDDSKAKLFYSCGLKVTGNITMTSGKLESIGGNADGSFFYSYGTSAEGDITVKGGELSGTGGESVSSHGIQGKNIRLETGKLTGKGGTASGTNYGIYAYKHLQSTEDCGNLTVSGGELSASCESANNSIGIKAGGNAKISGGTVTATSGAITGKGSTKWSWGMNVNNLEISGGAVVATGGGGTAVVSHGMNASLISISAGNVTAKSATLAEGASLSSKAMTSVPTNNNSKWIVKTSEAADATTSTAIEAEDEMSYKYINIVATALPEQPEPPEPPAPSGGGSYTPAVPTITIDNNSGEAGGQTSGEAGTSGGTAVYDSLTNKVTITPAAGFIIKDVTVNGVSKGAAAELTGIYGYEKITVTFEKQEPQKTPEQLQAEKNAKIKAGVEATRIIYPKATQLKNGKVKLTWQKTKGYKVDYYIVYRSDKKTSGFRQVFKSSTLSYTTSKNLVKGHTAFFKVVGVRKVDGKLIKTQISRPESIKIK